MLENNNTTKSDESSKVTDRSSDKTLLFAILEELKEVNRNLNSLYDEVWNLAQRADRD